MNRLANHHGFCLTDLRKPLQRPKSGAKVASVTRILPPSSSAAMRWSSVRPVGKFSHLFLFIASSQFTCEARSRAAWYLLESPALPRWRRKRCALSQMRYIPDSR